MIGERLGWRVTLTPPDDRVTPDAMACLARWNFYCPGEHPLWDRYSLNLVHLRDCAGLTPARKISADMTHELVVLAVDPAYSEADFRRGGIQGLSPLNYVRQFKATDLQAVRLCQFLASELVSGRLWAEPPLSGQVEPWESAINHFLETA